MKVSSLIRMLLVVVFLSSAIVVLPSLLSSFYTIHQYKHMYICIYVYAYISETGKAFLLLTNCYSKQ